MKRDRFRLWCNWTREKLISPIDGRHKDSHRRRLLFEASYLYMNFLSNLVYSLNRYDSCCSSLFLPILMSVDLMTAFIQMRYPVCKYVMLSFFISFQCSMFINNEILNSNINSTRKKKKTDCNLSYYRDQDSLLSLKSFFILRLKLTSQSVSLCIEAFQSVWFLIFGRLILPYMCVVCRFKLWNILTCLESKFRILLNCLTIHIIVYVYTTELKKVHLI